MEIIQDPLKISKSFLELLKQKISTLNLRLYLEEMSSNPNLDVRSCQANENYKANLARKKPDTITRESHRHFKLKINDTIFTGSWPILDKHIFSCEGCDHYTIIAEPSRMLSFVDSLNEEDSQVYTLSMEFYHLNEVFDYLLYGNLYLWVEARGYQDFIYDENFDLERRFLDEQKRLLKLIDIFGEWEVRELAKEFLT